MTQKPIYECVHCDDGNGWDNRYRKKKVTPATPSPRTFYEDKLTGELFYFLGRQKNVAGIDYIFQASMGQRTMSEGMVKTRMAPVNPTNPDYRFASIRDVLFHRDCCEQSSPKEKEVSRPFEDPNSPGYNPHKRGGDNPDPRKRY